MRASITRILHCCVGIGWYLRTGLIATPATLCRRSLSFGLCLLLLATAPAFSLDAPLKVLVAGASYLVSGTTVTGQTGSEPLDAATLDKARFTARVLDEQILHSDFNKRIFNAAYRAVIFADESSGRLIEPWRKHLRASSPAALAKAKSDFRTWVAKLAVDPSALMLAVAKQDYLDGIDAYRESAAIYRNVAKQNQILTYDDALTLMRNVWPTIQLVYARGLEEQLSTNAASTDVASRRQPSGNDTLLRRLQDEVVYRVDSDVTSAADLDRISAKATQIAEAESGDLRAYRDSVRPPTVRFMAYHPGVGSARLPAGRAGSITTTYGGQNTVRISVPTPLPKIAPALVDITGGILPSPYPIRTPFAAGPSRAANASVQTPAKSPTSAAGNGSAVPGAGTHLNRRSIRSKQCGWKQRWQYSNE
jgi:hypothetical protein